MYLDIGSKDLSNPLATGWRFKAQDVASILSLYLYWLTSLRLHNGRRLSVLLAPLCLFPHQHGNLTASFEAIAGLGIQTL